CTLSDISVDSTLHFSASFPLLCAVFPHLEVSSNSAPVKNVENKQKEYKKAKRIQNFICDEIDASCLSDTNHPYYNRPIFEAVHQDAYKVQQCELQWREEVEKLMLPTDLLKENIYMETPEMVFTREHANLVKEGEQWMKTTAESCSITAALIVTIVFAAAITVPGGSNQETGIPLFRKEIAFTIFAVADAISLFSAATSLL
ncbi:ankyrin repeat-containing protein, partial [Tanacetum coccineum]